MKCDEPSEHRLNGIVRPRNFFIAKAGSDGVIVSFTLLARWAVKTSTVAAGTILKMGMQRGHLPDSEKINYIDDFSEGVRL
jgi:hypothetical protein